jgi:hypothetical protein
MRALLVVVVAACGSKGPPTTTVAVEPPLMSTPPAPPIAPACPVMVRETSDVSWYGSVKEASAHLPSSAVDPNAPKLDLSTHHENAFFIERPEGYRHGSDASVMFVDAVFVQPDRITLVKHLFERIDVVPPPCGNALPPQAMQIAIINSHLGHIRIRRPAPDHAVLTTAAAHGEPEQGCGCMRRYQIADIFVDLDRGESLRTLSQIYQTECFAPGEPKLIAFGAYAVSDDGVGLAAPDCTYFWDE